MVRLQQALVFLLLATITAACTASQTIAVDPVPAGEPLPPAAGQPTGPADPLVAAPANAEPPTRQAPPTITPLPTSELPPATATAVPQYATLEEFWNGQAEWVLDIYDTGLPVGESDTVFQGDGVFWSYLHASHQSAGVVDQCGDPVAFPGCTTLWRSTDGGRSFRLDDPVCLFACNSCPCVPGREGDQIDLQQYPRVFFTADQGYLIYESGGYVYLRTSADGLNWSPHSHIPGTWVWTHPYGLCQGPAVIGEHPHIHSHLEYDCLMGGPPGIYIEGDTLYVFAAMGKAPGHMACLKGDRSAGAVAMQPCQSNPLFGAELGYGPVDVLGSEANPYFEFRTISSADVVRLGDHYYMTYEGIRGPSSFEVVDDQFALGLARSVGPEIDGPWEKFPGNPIIEDLPGNVGLGHADLLVIDGITYLYTATSPATRGRYVLLRIQ
jgi:hypothetical protein